METMQPVMKAGRNVWDKVNMPRSEFIARIEKIQAEMKKQKIDVTLIYGNGLNDYGNPGYFSNSSIPNQRGAIVAVPAKGDISYIYDGSSRDLPKTRLTTWVEDVIPTENMTKACIKYLTDKKFIPSTIGLIGFKQLMPYGEFQVIKKSIEQCKIVELDNILSDMRAVKSEKELDQVRRASEVLNHVLNLVSSLHSSAMTETMLEAILGRDVKLEGASDFRMLIARPAGQNWTFQPSGERKIAVGDRLVIYLAVEYERYCAEVVRTFVAGAAGFTEVEKENTAATFKRITDLIKQGVKVSDLCQNIADELQKNKTGFVPDTGLGQGVGLSLNESPLISGKDETELKPGMCFALRIAIKGANSEAVMVGNTVLLLKNGVEIATI